MYKDDIYEIQNDDMTKVSLDNDFGGMIIIKRPFFKNWLKRFKIKPIIKNGELKELKIYAPYGFVIKFFEMINYKPLISEEYSLRKWGFLYKYIYKEEWYNPHHPIYDEVKPSPFDDLIELPF